MAVAFLAACVSAACNVDSQDNDLDPFLCTVDDLGGGYQELVRGEFTPGDLAALGEESDEREQEFRDAGMRNGQFVFFKQVLDRPPFEPPTNVVCQVTQFESSDAAKKWVAALSPEASIDALAIAWIPKDGRRFRDNDSEATSLRQLFEVEAGEGAERLVAAFYTSASGRLVSTVAIGLKADAMTNEKRAILGELLERRAERLGDIVPPE